MTITTTVYEGNQTSIPSEIRKKYNVKPKDIVEWIIDDNGELQVKFRKKIELKDVLGMIKEEIPYNSVELKKMAPNTSKIPRLK
ncbi:AbrB/MazE/SpoVT family DNA-binding domain-containing protein [Methanobrevibacter sp. DSM 116169]|uniref:AbrB/MazE/SpoVT family DNA-binding domain-containing protein n=1 Tax=Methanobrevibacter sp. DSM 116169 TaxID=3242727 RepID=UPI0038FD00E9